MFFIFVLKISKKQHIQQKTKKKNKIEKVKFYKKKNFLLILFCVMLITRRCCVCFDLALCSKLVEWIITFSNYFKNESI